MKTYNPGDSVVIVRGPKRWKGLVVKIAERALGLRNTYLIDMEGVRLLMTGDQLRAVP